MNLNMRVFRWINGGGDGIAPAMHLFSEASHYAWFKVVVALLACFLIWKGDLTRKTLLQALIAFPLANWLTDLFKHGFHEPRPYQELHDVITHSVGALPTYGTSMKDASDFGTASAHSANMAAIAFVFCFHLKWWGTPWVLIALVTGYSRIYLGAHYPYQVLLGWTCGCACGYIVAKSWDLWANYRAQERRNLEADGTE